MKRSFLLIFILTLSVSLYAFDFFGIDIRGVELGSGVMMINNGVDDAAPSPLVNHLHLSVPTKINEFLSFRPEILAFWTNYGFENNRAIPLELDFDSLVMLALGFTPAVGLDWVIDPTLELGVETGPSVIFRTPIFPIGNGLPAEDILSLTGWFLAGRFLYWELGGGAVWKFSDFFSLGARLQTYLPIYALWDDLPLGDQIIWGLSLGIRFRFDE
jgi:hypothetical protein